MRYLLFCMCIVCASEALAMQSEHRKLVLTTAFSALEKQQTKTGIYSIDFYPQEKTPLDCFKKWIEQAYDYQTTHEGITEQGFSYALFTGMNQNALIKSAQHALKKPTVAVLYDKKDNAIACVAFAIYRGVLKLGECAHDIATVLGITLETTDSENDVMQHEDLLKVVLQKCKKDGATALLFNCCSRTETDDFCAKMRTYFDTLK